MYTSLCSSNKQTMTNDILYIKVRRNLICFQLACNEMQASARTCGRRAADIMIENVG